MVDSTEDRWTESVDGMCKLTKSADEIYGSIESADGRLDTLSYLRQGCCTCKRTRCRTCAGLVYLRTDGGGVSYLCRGLLYLCTDGVSYLRCRAAVPARVWCRTSACAWCRTGAREGDGEDDAQENTEALRE